MEVGGVRVNPVTLEEAYREACTALGEAVVQQRLLAAEIDRLRSEVERLRGEG